MNRYDRPGVQKLRTMRDRQSGRVMGILTCSVQLILGQGPALTVEDVIEGMVVSHIINPFGKVFVADEVQRAMRLGLARWLMIEMNVQRAVMVEKLIGRDGWQVVFELHFPNAEDVLLHVDTPGCSANDAVSYAMQEVANWCRQQSLQPLDRDILEALLDANLNGAPWLRAGLALMEDETVDASAHWGFHGTEHSGLKTHV